MRCRSLREFSKSVTFIWVLSHQGIVENDLADEAARKAISKAYDTVENIPLTAAEYKRLVYKKIMAAWNEIWISSDASKLQAITGNIWEEAPDVANRKDQSVITRPRIGHTNTTHNHLITHSSRNHCTLCNLPLTLKVLSSIAL